MPKLYKYSGAGNDFVILDGRTEDVSAFRSPERIAALCDRRTGFVAGDCLERSEVRISGPAGPGTLAETKSERGLRPQGVTGGGTPFIYKIQARIARLSVEFRALPDGSGFTEVYLTGPAEECVFGKAL